MNVQGNSAFFTHKKRLVVRLLPKMTHLAISPSLFPLIVQLVACKPVVQTVVSIKNTILVTVFPGMIGGMITIPGQTAKGRGERPNSA